MKKYVYLLLLPFLFYFGGCGGGNKLATCTGEGGSIELSFYFSPPQSSGIQTNMIPASTEFIVVEVQGVGLSETLTRTIPIEKGKSEYNITINNIPPGLKTVTARAESYGKSLLASRSVSVNVEAGKTSQVTLTLGIAIRADGYYPSTLYLLPGETVLFINETKQIRTIQGINFDFQTVLSPEGEEGSMASFKFNQEGSFRYYDPTDQSLIYRGLIIVKGEAGTGSIQGTVYFKPEDGGEPKPIGGVRVTASLVEDTATTSSSDREKLSTCQASEGFYSFPNLPLGNYLITVSGSGFSPVSKEVELTKAGEVKTQDFYLSNTPNIICINGDLSKRYKSLKDAMEAASAGDIVQAQGMQEEMGATGIYRESVTIKPGVTLAGSYMLNENGEWGQRELSPEEDTIKYASIIEVSDEGTGVVLKDNAKLSGFIINGGKFGVFCSSGEIQLEKILTSNHFVGINIGAGCKAQFDKVMAAKNLVGILIEENAVVDITDVSSNNNMGNGLYIKKGAKVTITGCDISQNNDTGIKAEEAEITISLTGMPEDHNEIRENNGTGIDLYKCTGSIEDAEISENKDVGVRLEECNNLAIKRNLMFGNSPVNSNPVIYIINSNSIFLQQNNISNPASLYIQGGSGEIKDNFIHYSDTYVDGIFLTEVGDWYVINNLVTDMRGGRGITIQNSSPVLVNNTIAYNQKGGIEVLGDSSNPKIYNSISYGNSGGDFLNNTQHRLSDVDYNDGFIYVFNDQWLSQQDIATWFGSNNYYQVNPYFITGPTGGSISIPNSFYLDQGFSQLLGAGSPDCGSWGTIRTAYGTLEVIGVTTDPAGTQDTHNRADLGFHYPKF